MPDEPKSAVEVMVDDFMAAVTPNYHQSNAAPSLTMDVSKSDVRECATAMLHKALTRWETKEAALQGLLETAQAERDALRDENQRLKAPKGAKPSEPEPAPATTEAPTPQAP